MGCNTKTKEDGMKTDIKARLVLKGFQEKECPRSDVPTISRDTWKLQLAIAANEGFNLKSIDITSAFLQGKEIS